MNRSMVRRIVPWAVAGDFPLLYLGAVTLESTAITIAALAVMGVSAAAAVLVY